MLTCWAQFEKALCGCGTGVREGQMQVRAELGSDIEGGCISGSGSRPHWSMAFTKASA